MLFLVNINYVCFHLLINRSTRTNSSVSLRQTLLVVSLWSYLQLISYITLKILCFLITLCSNFLHQVIVANSVSLAHNTLSTDI